MSRNLRNRPGELSLIRKVGPVALPDDFPLNRAMRRLSKKKPDAFADTGPIPNQTVNNPGQPQPDNSHGETHEFYSI